MRYVAIYRRGVDGRTPLTILKDARIRQISTAEELNLGVGRQLFIQIERAPEWYDYYLASAYRALEVEKKMKYVLYRHCYGFPDYLDDDLSIDNECFEFERLVDAMRCLANWGNGHWIHDEKYGKCRYYIAPEPCKGVQ